MNLAEKRWQLKGKKTQIKRKQHSNIKEEKILMIKKMNNIPNASKCSSCYTIGNYCECIHSRNDQVERQDQLCKEVQLKFQPVMSHPYSTVFVGIQWCYEQLKLFIAWYYLWKLTLQPPICICHHIRTSWNFPENQMGRVTLILLRFARSRIQTDIHVYILKETKFYIHYVRSWLRLHALP